MKRAEIKRKAQPAKPRAPMRKQKPSGAAAQCLQRKALSARSGGRCEMERPNLISGGWVRCGLRADDPAHVYTRPKCGAARDLLDAVIHACRPCHVRSEGRLATPMTRVPQRYAERAWEAILAHSRLGTDAEDRLRIHISSVGPRPEIGKDPYD